MKNSIVGILCFAGLCATGCETGESQDLPDEGTRSNQTYAAGGGSSGGKWGCKTCGFSNTLIWGTRESNVAAYGNASVPGRPSFPVLIDPSGGVWDVHFDQGQLMATDGIDKIGGLDLVGWHLRQKWPDGVETDVEIYNFQWIPDWTTHSELLPTYGFAYVDPLTGNYQNVCSELPNDETTVLFLQDERYDLGDGLVIEEPDVVSMACRGSALAKMALLGYRPSDGQSSVDERQATLRMIRADYCGDGTSYTDAGVPMDWTDALGNVEYDSSTMSDQLEAHWTAEGASCVGKPRLPSAIHNYQPGQPVPLPCAPPQCDETFDENVDGVWSSMAH